MYDKAVDDFISIIKFAPDCLLQVKWWKASQCFIASCFYKYSFLTKILVMLHFQVMKCVFLV